MDEIVKQLGFENEAELHGMVANVDISTQDRLDAFQKWQEEDGTKAGLAALPVLTPMQQSKGASERM